jgi:hypothetical protein
VTRAYVALQRQGQSHRRRVGCRAIIIFPVSVMGSTPALLLFLHGSADKSFLLSIGFSRLKI